MLTLDTSAIFALLNRRDPDHAAVRGALDEDSGPYLVPAGILGEVTYLIEDRLGVAVLDAFLADLEAGTLTFECGDRDFGRVRELVSRYRDLPLGAGDASVIACAERSGGLVLTLDRRDFTVVAREGRITPLPGRR